MNALGFCIAKCTKLLLLWCKTKTKIYRIFTNLQEEEENVWTVRKRRQTDIISMTLGHRNPTISGLPVQWNFGLVLSSSNGELQRTECKNLKSRRSRVRRSSSWDGAAETAAFPPEDTALRESISPSVRRLRLLFTRRWHSFCSSETPLWLL